MRILWAISISCFLCISFVEASGSGAVTPTWTVNGTDRKPCIMLKADITLNLTYNLADSVGGGQSWKEFALPHVHYSGSCDYMAKVPSDQGKDYNISSQYLRLTFDDPHGWYIEFYFSKDPQVHGSGSEFVMYLVVIYAEYETWNSSFPNPAHSEHTYQQKLDINGDPFGVQDSVFAETDYSYFCPSSQKYHVVDASDPSNPEAWITFKNFRVQAYADSDKFLQRETCPEDEVANDKVPVIVGGCLAGLVLITLVVYLVYRSRLPPSVLYLTNPNSHFEDLAFDNKGHSIEDEDEHEHEHHGHSHAHGHSHNHDHVHFHGHDHSNHQHDHFTEVHLDESGSLPSYK